MSFQATEWARGLPLPTIRLKFTLMMIGSYAGTDGVAFPSLTTLAEDTLQSPQTVRRRIRELEQLGLLVRFSRWMSPDGKLVLTQPSDDRPPGCRQSSDELRLQLKTTADQLLAAIEKAGLDGENEPSEQDDGTETDDSGEGISAIPSSPVTALAGGGDHGSDTGRVSPESNPLKRLSNPSGEAPPSSTPASGGGTTSNFDPELRQIGRKRLEIIVPIWPEPIPDAERAVMVLGALTEDEWTDCVTGVKGFAAFNQNLRDHGKHRVIKDFHNWARGHQWAGFLAKGAEVEKAGERIRVSEDSPEGRAWRVLHVIARIEPKAYDGRYLLSGPMTPQLLAFADASDVGEWCFIAETEKQRVGAWNNFLWKALGDRARPRLVDTRNWRGTRRIDEPGFLAPWAWPPRVDGSLSTGPPESEVA